MPRTRLPRRVLFSSTTLVLFLVLAALLWSTLPRRAQRRGGPISEPTSLSQPRVTPEEDAARRARLAEAYGELPLSFEANEGQTAAEVKFLSRGRGYSLFLTSTEAVIALRPSAPAGKSAVLRMSLAGANKESRVAASGELPGKSNYLIGNDSSKWRTNVSHFSRVKYEAVYEGVDLEYYGNQRQLEYDFRLAPGASPDQIRLAFRGAEKIRVDEATGDLVLETAGGEMRQRRPVVYQEVEGKRKEIAGSYALKNRREVGFELAEYDRALPLVIDPVLSYATYVGGNASSDSAFGIAVDSFGNAYITGETGANDYPTTAGVLDTTLGGSSDGFVTKLNATGTSLIYSTYLGGSNNDQGTGIAVDETGNAYVVGGTNSTDFPVANEFKTDQPTQDAFLSKLNPTGSALLYSTYIGGNSFEGGQVSVAADSAGVAYVVGGTQSSDFLTGPAPASTFDNTLGGTQDAFLVKVNTRTFGAASFVYGTFLGGSASDNGGDVAVDASGNMFVTGVTFSGDFPLLNQLDGNLGGTQDAFVSKFNAAGSALIFSTYHGGGGVEIGREIALDPAGNAYVTTDTNSTDFPITAGSAQTTFAGSFDATVTKFTPAGTTMVYSTFIGGSGSEFIPNIAVDTHGNAYVSGTTDSVNFPTVNSVFGFGGGGGDFFITKLNQSGSAFVYSDYLGGASFEEAHGIAVDPAGNAYVAGYTNSNNIPTTPGVFQPALNGGQDAIVAKFAQFGSCSQPAYAASTGSPFVAGTNPSFVTFGDFNEDGKQDLAVANLTSSNVSILLGDGTGSFGPATNFTTGTSPRSVAVGDFNEDGNQDLAVANNVSNNVSVLLGTGTGSFSAATNFPVGGGAVSVAVGDFNEDGNQDLATANNNTSNVSVLLGTGTGSFSAPVNFNIAGGSPSSVAVGDFNLDGNQDIAATDAFLNNVSVLLGDGVGGFAAAVNFGVGNRPESVAVGDFNLDGKPDIATANRNSNNVSVLLGTGTGSFAAAANFGVGTNPFSVVVGDLNGDGKPDLATANEGSNSVSVLLGNGAGSFSAAITIAAGTTPLSVALGDFNNDSRPDLTTANSGSNNVSVLLSSCGTPISNTIVVTNTNDSGAGSLRQAILDSNATAGVRETITFNIPGAGVQTITPTTTALPTITDPVVIDGYTQPGASPNTLAVGNNAVLLIEFDGTNQTDFKITGGGSTVRGLVFNKNAGLVLQTGGGNTIQGNFFGTNAAGTAADSAASICVDISSSSNNVIGGTTPAARNLLSNALSVAIFLSNANGNTIRGNYIGTNAAGTAAIPNRGGIEVGSGNNNVIGGTAAGAGNVISGSSLDSGITFNTGNGNTVQGNLIGVAADGVSPMGNAFSGIILGSFNTGSNNLIGGTATGAGNVIANNGRAGVQVGGTNNSVLSNSIFNNGATANDVGIDLNFDGVTPNDAGDADTGANNLQNFPVLTSATTFGANTNIAGTLNSTASTAFTLQFFSNAACDASGNGEGRTLLGSANVTTDGSGNVSFDVTLPAGVAAGEVVTATATSAATNDTSEFSACSTAATVTSCGSAGFAAATNFGIGNNPNAVAVGDFNGDGNQDLVTANQLSNNVSVLLGNGAGSFGAATNFNTASNNPISVAVGDFNGDGKQDLAVATFATANVSILLGNGAGSFGAATSVPTGAAPRVVVVGDFNGDGNQDIATANSGSNNVSILLGNGAGGFSAPTNFGVGSSALSMAIGDFNGDGNQDIATANSGSNNVSILLGNGAGSFAAATNFSLGSVPVFVAVGDFNADGNQDLAVADTGAGITVLLGNGAGSFGTPTDFAAGTNPNAVAVGDFNGDGNQDLAVANITSNDVSVLFGDGAGSFGAAANFAVGTNPNYIVVGDFNGDSKPDVATTNQSSNDVSILLNNCTAGAQTFTVNSNNDVDDGTCNAAHCSLREAINAANALAGTDTIAFNIAGAGVHTITPATALPTITDPVIIDGYTQPGSSVNTLAVGDNAVLLIELNGASLSQGNGLVINASGSTVRGLVINRFNDISGADGNGIVVHGSFNLIAGCFIGLSADGTTALANDRDGIFIDNANNFVGGNAPAARNVISGNGLVGVHLSELTATGNDVLGNYIGTSASGTNDLGNGQDGVMVAAFSLSDGAPNNDIGGAFPGEGNVISGNNGNGILVAGDGSAVNRIRGNFVGLAADGVTALGNSAIGVRCDGSNFLTIGGATTSAANRIAFNGLDGVTLTSGATSVAILSNSIYANGTTGNDLGIDLIGAPGVDANDAGDGDSGANNLQNFPVLTSATTFGANTNVAGTLNSTASTTFTLQFFSNAACDASGNGEGQQFLGSTTVVTDGTGNASFNAMLTGVAATGTFITATATDASGNTSEFSACQTAAPTASCGSASFATATNFPVGTDPTSAQVGDFNGDGKLDIAAANSSSNNVSVLLGNGAGSFGTAANFGVGTAPQSVAVGDFNGDEKLDLATANFTSDNVSVLLGDGTGSFSAAANFGTGDGPISVAVGDFNGDANQDLAVANTNASTVSILLGDGAGNFGAATNFGVGLNPFVVVVDDFNGDGKLDLATANFNSTNVSVLLGDGGGSFGAATNFAVAISPQSVTVGDFNGDGKRDLATANFDSNDVSVLLGDGMGSFAAATNFGAGSNPYSVAVGDFDGDGKQDLAVANQSSANVSVLLGNGAGGFAAATNFGVGSFPFSVAVGDFNGDGKPDLTTANDGSNNVSVLLNNCTPPAATTFTVNSANDVNDGTCNATHCSLREAINAANANTGFTDTIAFNIAGAGVHTISPASALPDITDTAIIDGYTQPGASANTLVAGDNAVLRIELNGAGAGANVDGLRVIGNNSIVRGLAINRFSRNGITLIGATGNGKNITISGNFLGTDAAGAVALGNGSNGIGVENGLGTSSDNSLIGGTTPAARNIISGNGRGMEFVFCGNGVIRGNFIGLAANGTTALGNANEGVRVSSFTGGFMIGGDDAADGTTDGVVNARNYISANGSSGIFDGGTSAGNCTIQGNYIGTDVTGTLARPNSGGISTNISNGTIVGGATPGAGNLISGNNGDGIGVIFTDNFVIKGNRIGTKADGVSPLGNTGNGVALVVGSGGTQVGGTAAGEANIIAFNGGDGVFSDNGATNAILSNSIHSNGTTAQHLGIDLGTDGVTANDAGDGDTGANNLQNFPVLTSASSAGGNTTIVGTLNSEASKAYRVEFFSNAACDASGNGEGRTFLGSTTVNTDGSGNATINTTLLSATSAGEAVTATATDPANNTSEFSACVTVAAGAQTFTVTNTNDTGAGSLRQAITDANASTGTTDTIAFNIAGAGVKTISPASALPIITDPVIIDGYTQPGASANTLAVGNNAILLIEIGGSVFDGLTLGASVSTVRGLLINNTSGFGIRDQSAGGNTIKGNWIGINAAGTTQIVVNGVFINSSNNTIGGTAPGDRNVITGSASNGAIVVFSGSGNAIQGNYIGTNATGSAGLGNGGISLSNNTTVGGTASGAGNVISGGNDVSMFSKTNCVVQGNFVGVSADGTALLGNAFGNIFINTSQGNLIGGTTAAARNVVATSIVVNGVSGGGGGNTIQGNFIGTNAAGNAAVGALASSSGIVLNGSNNIVGGAAAGAGNVIANHSTGIAITGANNTTQGNFIGTNAAGTAAIANSTGISMSGGASVTGNLVGGTTAAARNVISGNSGTGVSLGAGTLGVNTLQGNFIGAGADGGALGNGGDGVRIVASLGQIIGGIGAGEGNLIAFNAVDGVNVSGGAGHAILSNSIHSNGTTNLHLGIDLGTDGVQANDAGDGDTGANNLQNFPVLTSATSSGGNTTIQGTFNSESSKAYRVEFFSNAACDASGNGEGRTFIGFANVNTDASGNAAINSTLGVATTLGEIITATATDPTNNTSEFSACQTVTAGAAATDVSWINAAGGNWNTAANWQDGTGVNRVPTAGDNVFITITGTYTVTLDVDASVNSLTLGTTAGPGTQTFNKGNFTLTLAAASSVQATGVFNHPGGDRSQTGASTLTVQGVYNWTGGNVNGTGSTTALAAGGTLNWSGGTLLTAAVNVASGATVNISGAADKELFGGSGFDGALNISAGGTAVWTGTGRIVGSGGGSSVGAINNSGLFNAQNDSSLIPNFGNGGRFNNLAGGVFRKSVGTGTTTFGNVFNFSNAGTLDIQTGTLSIQSDATLSDGAQFTGAGLTRFDGAVNGRTLNILANATIGGTGTFEFASGTLTTGAGAALTLNNSFFNWTGGTFSQATVNVASGATINISGTADKVLFGSSGINGVLNINAGGTALWTGTGRIGGGGGGSSVGAINNSGTFVAQNDSSFINSFGNGGVFTNLAGGIFRKSIGVGTTTFTNGFSFSNAGTMDVQTGTLNFANGYTQTAGSTILNGGALQLGNTLQLQGGTLGGVGTINGNVNNTGGTVAPGLSPGCLDINGNYTQGAAGALHIEIGGATVCTQFDRLAVTGAATLDGTINITLIGGFNPPAGQSFQVMTFGSRTGTFPTVNGPFTLNFSANALNIVKTGGAVTLGNYANTTVQLGANATVTPDAAPTGTTRITVSTSTNFKGTLEGDPATGIVRVTDAHPAGVYTVMVTAFDGTGATTQKTFTLTVTTPATCNPITFAAAANFGVGTQPVSVAIGDFNGDGKQDLAEANASGGFGAGDVSVSLGNGAGGFGSSTPFTVGTTPLSVAVGDFNGDGKQDLAAANGNSNNVSVLLGNGAGSFAAAANFAAGTAPVSVAVGDFNGDGKQDLATANRNSNNVSVLLGDGAGSFAAATNFAVGNSPQSIAVGDFNNDGKQDLAVANQNSNTVSVLLGNGAGGFSAATNFAVGSLPLSVVIGDFNGDGKQDLAAANSGANNVSVLLGDGAGGFSAATNFAVGVAPFSVAIGDFDGDGKQDLATANQSSNNVSVLLGDGAGSFGAATNFGAGTNPRSVAVGDFNGDGKQDLATANQGSDNVSILLRQCPAAPQTFTVTNTNDTGAGSLRQAILDANSNAGQTDTIAFNIAGAGVQTISPASALPAITDPVVIDGYTQPGSSANTLAAGDNAVLLIELNGTGVGVGGVGLNITAGSSTVRGLVINRFNSEAVSISGAGGNQITGNFLGTNAAGTSALANAFGVLIVAGSDGNTVGGTTPAARNVISGNTLLGVLLGTNGNTVSGNFIGTNAAGNAALGNVSDGVRVNGGSSNIIGGTAAGAGNVVSGNAQDGVFFNGGSNNVVQGNLVGTNAAGTAAIANGNIGVHFFNATNNTVGGTTPAARNVISGNTRNSVGIEQTGSTGNVVQGNFIGTDAAGNAAIGNGLSLAVSSGASLNIIGGTAAGAGNVVSGNAQDGINFFLGAHDNRVEGNLVGMNATGTAPLGNQANGITLDGAGTNNNAIGGTTPAARNVISGNTGGGVVIQSGASGNTILGNFIGTNPSGASAVANGGAGVQINAANGNSVGGAAAGAANVIAFNGGDGVQLDFGTGNAFLSNSIHSNGTTAQQLGIDLGADGSTANDVGDPDAGANNLQNFPSITSAIGNGVAINVNGTLNSTPNTTFRVEFFANTACDASGSGEGRFSRGSENVTTDAEGNASFTHATTGTLGEFITATATDAANNTSEFSPCAQVAAPVVTFTISGRIAEGANGLSGVTVTLSGSQAATTSTDLNGNYSFASLAPGGNYTVTPALAGFTFVPTSRTFNNLSADQTADFVANAVVTFSISGRVRNANANGVPGVLVTLSGSLSATTNTDANGDYSFSSLTQGGNFTVTPTLAGFTFTPPSRTFNNLQANQTAADFTTSAVTHTLSGRVTDNGGQGILGINLTLSGTQSAVTTTDAAGNYSFAGLANGGNFTLTPSETNFRFDPVNRQVNNLQADVGGVNFTGRLVNHTITGRIVDAQGGGIPDVLVTLSGALSAVTRTDQQGNFVFNDVPTSGSFNITPEKTGFTFEPRRQNVTGINSDVQFAAVGAVQPSPTPTPDPSDDFSGTQIDFERWIIGILTNPPPAFDPLVSVFQAGGLLHIQPRADANGPSYSGLVSIRTIDLNASPAVSVEVVQAAQGEGTQTIFGLGTDDKNWFRFVVEDASTTQSSVSSAPPGAKSARAASSSSSSAAPSATPTPSPQNLLFQISLGGSKFSTGPLAFDPALHRFWRFRHDAPARLIIFETSPDAQNWTERFRAEIARGQTNLIAELSAGTLRASRNPTEALFDNFLLSPSPRLQFTTRGASASEGGGAITINVLRTGSAESPVSVDFATGGGTATAGTDYAATSGTLTFGVNERLKTISVPIFNDALEEPDETINIALRNPVGGGLGSVTEAVLTILDDDRARNSIDESEFFVRQHYRDFLGRDPDAAGLAFWVNNIESCGADAQCRDIRRVDTSAAFFLSIEFQETGYFVHRFYKASFNRAPLFAEYLPDLQTIREGVVIGEPGALDRLEANKRAFAAQWVNRPAFKERFDRLNEMQYVDALYANAGVTPTEGERTALIVGLLTRRETRAGVLRQIIEDDDFERAEFNRAFVLTQYFGYLRRDPDTPGFNFWLKKLNDNNGDFRAAEMVKAFITSLEYRRRFGQP